MQPNSPDQNEPLYSVDYLNKIAPQQQNTGLPKKWLIIFGALGGLVILVFGFIIFAGAGQNSASSSLQTLAARLEMLEGVARDSQRTIRSSNLRSINGNTSTFLTNTNRAIDDALLAANIDPNRLQDSATARASRDGETLKATLEDARLNAVFDRTYARHLAYELEQIAVLLGEVKARTSNSTIQAFVEATEADLESLQRQFSSFNEATG